MEVEMILNLMEFMLVGAVFILCAGALILVLAVLILWWDFSREEGNDCE